MNESEREALIISLCFLSGKEEWWFKDMEDQALIEMYDRLNAIYK